MSKFKISYISDCVFVFFFSFMIFFAPVSFFIKKKILAAIVAFFAAVIPLTIFIFVSRKKFGRLAVKKTEEEEYERTKTAFLLSNDDFVEKNQKSGEKAKRLFYSSRQRTGVLQIFFPSRRRGRADKSV